MIKVWPTETVLKPFDTGDAADLRGDARKKKKMRNKVDDSAVWPLLVQMSLVFITETFLYIGVMLTCKKLHLAVQCFCVIKVFPLHLTCFQYFYLLFPLVLELCFFKKKLLSVFVCHCSCLICVPDH